jgi:HK97 family phage prohead protease
MPMKPHKGESESEFMSRCVPEMIGSGENKRPQEQAVAICIDLWKNRDKTDKQAEAPPPDPGESHGEYIDRCVQEMLDQDDNIDEGEAEDICQIEWESRMSAPVMHKVHADHGVGDPLSFILSDATPDRYGDVIAVEGWQLANFKRNPIALFSHDPKFIVGKWKNLRVESASLRGDLELAQEGTSERIDEIRRLVSAGILKAVSVGFKPIEHEAIDKEDPWGGVRYTKSELVETSLVAVPANPNALAVAKSFGISPDTLRLVFAKHGTEDETTRRRDIRAKHGEPQHRNDRRGAMTLAQRIQNIEASIVAKRAALDAILESMDDSNVKDDELQGMNDLNGEIAKLEKIHDGLIESEKRLARASDNGGGTNGNRSRELTVIHDQRRTNGNGQEHEEVRSPVVHRGGRKKDFTLLDLLARAGVVTIRAKEWGIPVDVARQRIYGEDLETREICDIVVRGAVAPAMTTVTGWAAELVQPRYEALLPLLMPKAILTRLAPRGLALDFGTAGRIVIPSRQRTPSLAGSFVGEGMPIPVRQGAFTSLQLTRKKVGVISVWTREMEDASTPAIEGVIREAIQDDTSVVVDSILIDANAATVIRPAGLLNGVAALTATTGGGLNALVGDILQLVGAITTATYGNLRNLVWLMNPAQTLSASLTGAAATGVYPFKDEIARGTLANIPIIDSATVPAKTVILVDAADFVSVGGGAPRFDMSDSATIHMEDTTPLELVGTGSPGTVASPQRSLFQTDSLALRMVMPLNWANRRTGTVAWTQNVTW